MVKLKLMNVISLSLVCALSVVARAHDLSSRPAAQATEVESPKAVEFSPSPASEWVEVSSSVGQALYDVAETTTYSDCKKNDDMHRACTSISNSPDQRCIRLLDFSYLKIYRRRNGRQPLYRVGYPGDGGVSIEATTDPSEHRILALDSINTYSKTINFGSDFAHAEYRSVPVSYLYASCHSSQNE